MLKNDLILRAATGQPVERVPVWLMRQAGRVLPEYRAVRAKLSGFKELVTTPHLAAEVTVQPVDLLGVDAAIIFSDILVIPEAMGLPYDMIEERGPVFHETVKTEADILKLRVADAADLNYVAEAIKITKKELNDRVPLIGFAGAPWTIFCYMTEGGGSKTFSKAKKWIYQNPLVSHRLLDMIADSTIAYLKSQVAAGADMLQVFDSWAGILGPEEYAEFGLKYMHKIAAAVQEVPMTLFAKDAHYALEGLAATACQTIGLDWTLDAASARSRVGGNKTLQGNMDPCALYASPEVIKTKTQSMLRAFGKDRYIANLGHGLYPDLKPDSIKIFIDTIKEFRF